MDVAEGKCSWSRWHDTDLQHGLLVLTVLHLGGGQVENGPLHRVSLRVVDVNVWPPHNHVALHPSIGVRLQEVDVALLRYDWAEKHMNYDMGVMEVGWSDMNLRFYRGILFAPSKTTPCLMCFFKSPVA